MRVFVLANPKAGSHQARKYIQDIQKTYPQLDIKVYLTQGPDDEKHQVAAILKEFTLQDRLLVLGGDGTLSKTLTAWPVQYPFAYFPTGSGNDFAKSMDIHQLDQIMEALVRDKKESIFVLHSSLGVIINTLDMGFAAQVIEHATDSGLKDILNKIKLGKLTYLLCAIRSLLSHQAFDLSLEVDGRRETIRNLFFFSIANNTYFGGGIMIWPEAQASQKQLDLVYIEDAPLSQRILALLDLVFKRHRQSHRIKHVTGERVAIDLEETFILQLDGEMSSTNSLTITCQERFIYQ